MDAKGYSRIPRELCYWITFLAEALPLRSVGTFIELLIGAMLTPAGFVTEAYLVVTMRNHWSSYYKWLQKGRWSWLGLSRQFVRLILKVVKQEVIHLVIDDTDASRLEEGAGEPDSSSAWQQAEFGAICKRPMLGQPGLGDQARETAGGLALVDPPGSWYQ